MMFPKAVKMNPRLVASHSLQLGDLEHGPPIWISGPEPQKGQPYWETSHGQDSKHIHFVLSYPFQLSHQTIKTYVKACYLVRQRNRKVKCELEKLKKFHLYEFQYKLTWSEALILICELKLRSQLDITLKVYIRTFSLFFYSVRGLIFIFQSKSWVILS